MWQNPRLKFWIIINAKNDVIICIFMAVVFFLYINPILSIGSVQSHTLNLVTFAWTVSFYIQAPNICILTLVTLYKTNYQKNNKNVQHIKKKVSVSKWTIFILKISYIIKCKAFLVSNNRWPNKTLHYRFTQCETVCEGNKESKIFPTLTFDEIYSLKIRMLCLFSLPVWNVKISFSRSHLHSIFL